MSTLSLPAGAPNRDCSAAKFELACPVLMRMTDRLHRGHSWLTLQIDASQPFPRHLAACPAARAPDASITVSSPEPVVDTRFVKDVQARQHAALLAVDLRGSSLSVHLKNCYRIMMVRGQPTPQLDGREALPSLMMHAAVCVPNAMFQVSGVMARQRSEGLGARGKRGEGGGTTAPGRLTKFPRQIEHTGSSSPGSTSSPSLPPGCVPSASSLLGPCPSEASCPALPLVESYLKVGKVSRKRAMISRA